MRVENHDLTLSSGDHAAGPFHVHFPQSTMLALAYSLAAYVLST